MSKVKQIVISINGVFWNMKAHREVDIDIGEVSFDGLTEECLDAIDDILTNREKK